MELFLSNAHADAGFALTDTAVRLLVTAMLYEITIWRRTAGAAQRIAASHELGHLSSVREIAKSMLRQHPGASPAHYVKVCEAHNGREVFVWKLDGRS